MSLENSRLFSSQKRAGFPSSRTKSDRATESDGYRRPTKIAVKFTINRTRSELRSRLRFARINLLQRASRPASRELARSWRALG